MLELLFPLLHWQVSSWLFASGPACAWLQSYPDRQKDWPAGWSLLEPPGGSLLCWRLRRTAGKTGNTHLATLNQERSLGTEFDHPSNCPPPQVGRFQIEVVNSQTSATLVRSLKAQTLKNPPRMQTSSQRLSRRGGVQLYKHEQSLSAEPTLVCHHRNLPLSPLTNLPFHLFQHETHKNTALLPLKTHTHTLQHTLHANVCLHLLDCKIPFHSFHSACKPKSVLCCMNTWFVLWSNWNYP